MIRLDLNEIVDPFGARIVVQVDADGRTSEAWFDLVGLPRVDALLLGRPVAEAPGVVERLCGICPAAHHLAGIRALDALAGSPDLTPTAVAVRRLLHLGSGIETHAVRFVAHDRDAAVALRRFGKAAMAAAGSPGHFPTTAVVGGVRAGVPEDAAAALRAEVPGALAAAERVAAALVGGPGSPAGPAFADVALVDGDGRPDLLGTHLRAVAPDGAVLVEAAVPEQWLDLVTEERPGAVAPRPYLTALGPERGGYRVGPVAQLRIGVPATPRAASWRERWLATEQDATAARAVVTLGAVEAAGVLLEGAGFAGGGADTRTCASRAPHRGPHEAQDRVSRTGTGWVDGPRGLLVHTYTADADGVLVASRILTPTAQNERWLAALLTAASGERDDPGLTGRLEASIRAADPCLPVSSAPAGAMGLDVDVRPSDHGREEAR